MERLHKYFTGYKWNNLNFNLDLSIVFRRVLKAQVEDDERSSSILEPEREMIKICMKIWSSLACRREGKIILAPASLDIFVFHFCYLWNIYIRIALRKNKTYPL